MEAGREGSEGGAGGDAVVGAAVVGAAVVGAAVEGPALEGAAVVGAAVVGAAAEGAAVAGGGGGEHAYEYSDAAEHRLGRPASSKIAPGAGSHR